ncbi:MAG: SdpI family protein [Oscillospiraceae bacterium]|nr:SdpI family protein [Oscillospiraceae bacterium]
MKVFFIIGSLIIPAIYLLDGFILWKYPPKLPANRMSTRMISMRSGYKSKISLLNEDTWSFTQHYCGVLWIRLGAVLAGVGIIAMVIELFLQEEVAAAICLGLILAEALCLLVTRIPIDGTLKRTFTDTGQWRDPQKAAAAAAAADTPAEPASAGGAPSGSGNAEAAEPEKDDEEECEDDEEDDDEYEDDDDDEYEDEDEDDEDDEDDEGSAEERPGGGPAGGPSPGSVYKPGRRKKRKNRG